MNATLLKVFHKMQFFQYFRKFWKLCTKFWEISPISRYLHSAATNRSQCQPLSAALDIHPPHSPSTFSEGHSIICTGRSHLQRRHCEGRAWACEHGGVQGTSLFLLKNLIFGWRETTSWLSFWGQKIFFSYFPSNYEQNAFVSSVSRKLTLQLVPSSENLIFC